MPFEWYRSDVQEHGSGRAKADEMYETELRERASLLLRLGYAAGEAKLRLRGNVRWDFELHEAPSHLELVEAVVDQVYATRRSGTGGPPSVEG